MEEIYSLDDDILEGLRYTKTNPSDSPDLFTASYSCLSGFPVRTTDLLLTVKMCILLSKSYVPCTHSCDLQVTNACATQAIMSVLMNNADIELGQAMADFKTTTITFPPEVDTFLPFSDFLDERLGHW